MQRTLKAAPIGFIDPRAVPVSAVGRDAVPSVVQVCITIPPAIIHRLFTAVHRCGQAWPLL